MMIFSHMFQNQMNYVDTDDHYADSDLVREAKEREMKDQFIEEFWLLEKSLSNWKKVINHSLK